MLKRAQVKVEVQVKIERSIETEPTGGAQGGVALAAAGGSGFVCFLCDGPDLSDPDHPNHNSWRSAVAAHGAFVLLRFLTCSLVDPCRRLDELTALLQQSLLDRTIAPRA